jgi:hypothetical protein
MMRIIKEYIKTLCGQNADIFNAKLGAACVNHEAEGLKEGLVEGRRWFLSHGCNSASPFTVRHKGIRLVVDCNGGTFPVLRVITYSAT